MGACPALQRRSLLRAERRAVHRSAAIASIRAEREDTLRQGGPGFETHVQTPR
jgi:hypothetical protein